MRRFLACALLMVAGCGEPEPEQGQGTTLVTLTDVSDGAFPEFGLTCANDPPPSEDEVRLGFTFELTDSGEWQMYLNPPPGPCTLLIRLRDDSTGDVICLQQEEIMVSEVGDTEVDITVGCEPDRTAVGVEPDATCLDSAGVVEPDEEGACTFQVSCPIRGGFALPIKVRPLPTVVVEEGRSRAALEQTLLLTSAIRASLPEIEQWLVGGRSVEYGLEAPSGLTTFSAGASGGALVPPVEGEAAIPIDFERAVVEFDHDPAVEFSVDLLRVSLSVSFLADELVCEVAGDATVLYSP